LQDLAGGSPSENAAITLGILKGEKGPKRDVVLLNAGAALVVAGTWMIGRRGAEAPATG